jgi:Icc protein
MRVQSISSEPVHYIQYLHAGTKGRIETAQLPISRGVIEKLPTSLDAIVCAGDLQGISTSQPGQEPKLLGEFLADELFVLLETLDISPSRTGIILSGDLFSSPQADRRGASGDVRRVWLAFQQRFRWVAGVLGNHDQIGFTTDDFQMFFQNSNLHYLDGNAHSTDGLSVAGISGIIGNSSKPLRRSASDFLSTLARLNRKKPDLIVLHQSPSVAAQGCLGSDELGAIYEKQEYPLTICGHVSWPFPLVELENGNQILNVDSRAIILSP